MLLADVLGGLPRIKCHITEGWMSSLHPQRRSASGSVLSQRVAPLPAKRRAVWS